MNMEIRILLFVEDDVSRQKYLDALTSCGARVFATPSFFYFSEEILNQTYHGLLIDVTTKLRAIK